MGKGMMARYLCAGGGLVALAWLVFPGAMQRARRCKGDARFWAEVALQVARSGSFARASGLYDLLSLDDVSADGEIRACVRVNSDLQDMSQALHTGAAALVADEVTTASIMSQRCYPGVSILLSVSRAANCAPGSAVYVTSRILRQGRKLIHTEAIFKAGPEEEAAVLLVCSHVKYCEAPAGWLPLLWLRTSIARLLVKSFVHDSTRPQKASHTTPQNVETLPNLVGFERVLLPASVSGDRGFLQVVLE